MRATTANGVSRIRLRRVVAALFCLLFVADWASHTAMPHHLDLRATAAASSNPDSHEHCSYFCRGDGHREKTTPQANADGFQHNGTLVTNTLVSAPSADSNVTAFSFPTDVAILRSVSPPFLPPEIS